ncbi:unnamed protein product [Ilex paraguariensis]|uniref:Uncharacterized protein n=1 Tax=Ilex paraguariensis TaxID=185542 RepID=A0ABC8UBH2_9AQUA
MAKKKMLNNRRKKRDDFSQIDHIPKYSHKPRSPNGHRRRTDYSLFFSQESSSNKRILSGVSVAISEESKDMRSEVLDQCCKFHLKRQESAAVPVREVELLAQDSLLEPCANREQ